MIYSKRGEKAKEFFLSGYNCSQSVALAFADLIGLPSETILKLSQPFGGGMSRLREVCGTFSGALFVIGQLYGDTEPNSPNKAKVYSIVQEYASAFKAVRGSIICRDILGLEAAKDTDPAHPAERTNEYYRSRPCGDVCAEAATLLENYLLGLGVEL